MRIRWDEVTIYLRTGYTDMRKQIGSLAVLVQEEMKMNPFGGSLFVFCGCTRRLMKVLYWDRNGFCLWMKRLEKDRFPWPGTAGEVRQANRKELFMVLAGIDFFSAHEEIKYNFMY
jgi:transposase